MRAEKRHRAAFARKTAKFTFLAAAAATAVLLLNSAFGFCIELKANCSYIVIVVHFGVDGLACDPIFFPLNGTSHQQRCARVSPVCGFLLLSNFNFFPSIHTRFSVFSSLVEEELFQKSLGRVCVYVWRHRSFMLTVSGGFVADE